MTRRPRHALVFGASGLIGRHLVLQLARAGAHVTAAVRTPESGERLMRWLRDHNAPDPGTGPTIDTITVDFAAADMVPGGPDALAGVSEIHSCAGAFRFGMTAQEARAANVGIVERIVHLAATLPTRPRVVHVSGYRVGAQDGAWSEARRDAVYRELGAYEASKVESDVVLRARADELGVPWTVVNPASVIGDSETGESDQLIGLAASIQQVWAGTVTALPGDRTTFVPVVTVDHLASFMAAAATDPAAEGQSYWVLDDDTPALPELLTQVGRHLGVPVPRLRIPAALVKRLPQRLTRADPETLSFLSSDRYPTGTARQLADRHGIEMPDVATSLERWADHLALHRFGTSEGERRFVTAGGLRTLQVGPSASPRLVLPGLPVNADTWAPVAKHLEGRVVDLPGLGLSQGSGVEDWDRWLPDVLGEAPVDLVGHSVGAAAALVAARLAPERVASLTLVAPFFLQPLPARAARGRMLTAAYLRRTDTRRLSRLLTGDEASADALATSVDDLRRGAARTVAEHLALASSQAWRSDLTEALMEYGGRVRVVTGSHDPLTPDARELVDRAPHVELVTVPGAGHHPQLTHPRELAALIGSFLDPSEDVQPLTTTGLEHQGAPGRADLSSVDGARLVHGEH